MARTKAPLITEAEYLAAMVKRYASYDNDELTQCIATRTQVLADGFLTARERKDFAAHVKQMTMVLEARTA
jgi:phage host-nuclease inhibitor protein Gam